MKKWRDVVNQSLGAVRIENIQSFLSEASRSDLSPIDLFIKNRRALLSLSNRLTPVDLELIGPQILVSIISQTETYIRNIVAGTLVICPVSQKLIATRQVSAGSVSWRGVDNLGLSILEHISLADQESIKKACSLIGCNISSASSPITPILVEFDKICELRHAAVHSSCIISGKGAVYLELSRTGSQLQLNIDKNQLESAASIASSLVYTINSEFFALLSKRWAVDWRASPSWQPLREKKIFRAIWDLFFSTYENRLRDVDYPKSSHECSKLIKMEYGI